MKKIITIMCAVLVSVVALTWVLLELKHEHKFTEATCENPSVCICGEVVGEALGHIWHANDCVSPGYCERCGQTQGEAAGHDWKAATCSSPQECSRCKEKKGSALGHDWENATCTSPKKCSRCGKTEGYAKGHDWLAATCTTPKECSRCGAVSGSAKGHSWRNATCTKAKECSRCGVTEGTALGHSWNGATCTKAETCSLCGSKKGTALGHDWAEATYTAPKTCKRCGEKTGDPLSPKFVNISIHTLPAQTKYNVGEAFNDKGITIRLNYSDGSYKVKESGFTVSGFSSAEKGTKTIKVQYVYQKVTYTTTFKVDVVIEDVALSKIEPFEKKNYYQKAKDKYDRFGNYYDVCCCFYDDYARPYVTYYVNGNYNRLIGTFAIEKDAFCYSNGEMIVNIYADDKLIFSKDKITKTTGLFSVDLDISGCKYLKIQVVTNKYGYMLFCNAELKK